VKFRNVFEIIMFAVDLQSSASPLRHEASQGQFNEPWRAFRTILEKSQEVISEKCRWRFLKSCFLDVLHSLFRRQPNRTIHHCMEEYQPRYKWALTWPDDRDETGKPPQIFQGYDGTTPVGSIQLMKGGPQKGQWSYAGHGPKVRERLIPHTGFAPTAREACRAAEDYYDRLIKHNETLK